MGHAAAYESSPDPRDEITYVVPYYGGTVSRGLESRLLFSVG